jgi:hypothetical protein
MTASSSLFEEDSLVSEDVRNTFEKLFESEWSGLGSGIFRKSVPGDYVFGAYCYGIFHSLRYREKFFDYLSTGFPRIPVPIDKNVTTQLIILGDQLVRLHLGENPVSVGSVAISGAPSVLIGGAEFSNNSIKITDKSSTELVICTPVEKQIWDMEVGGYQVAQKWIKDRRGMFFTQELQSEYVSLISILSETLRIMEEVDSTVDTSELFGV